MDRRGRFEPRPAARVDCESGCRGLRGPRPEGNATSLKARAFIGLVVEINASTLEFCGSTSDEVHSIMNESGYRPMNGLGTFELGNEFFVPE